MATTYICQVIVKICLQGCSEIDLHQLVNLSDQYRLINGSVIYSKCEYTVRIYRKGWISIHFKKFNIFKNLLKIRLLIKRLYKNLRPFLKEKPEIVRARLSNVQATFETAPNRSIFCQFFKQLKQANIEVYEDTIYTPIHVNQLCESTDLLKAKSDQFSVTADFRSGRIWGVFMSFESVRNFSSHLSKLCTP